MEINVFFFKLGTISVVEGKLTILVWGMTWLKMVKGL